MEQKRQFNFNLLKIIDAQQNVKTISLASVSLKEDCSTPKGGPQYT